MKQLELSETLFLQLLKCFNEYIQLGERPTGFYLGFQIEKPNIHRLVSEIDSTTLTPRIHKLVELSNQLIDLWDNKVYSLEQNESLECFFIDQNYRIWKKINNPAISIKEWSDRYSNVEFYTYDKLLDYADVMQGYCSQRFNLAPPA